MDFKDLLLAVVRKLSESEAKALVFLCKDLVDQDVLESGSARDLFACLERRGHLKDTDPQLLAELLSIIHRDPLMEELGLMQPTAKSLICTYRKLLYQLSEEITKENLVNMKFRLETVLPKKELDKVTTLEFFLLLEDNNLLNKAKLDRLQKLIGTECPKLKDRIPQYKKQHGGRLSRSRSLPGESEASPPFRKAGSLELTVRDEAAETLRASSDRRMSQTSDTSHVFFWPLFTITKLCTALFTKVSTIAENLWARIVKRSGEVSSYPMNSVTRGVILIISNFDFTRSKRPMSNRYGTEADERSLRTVFDWLGFIVEIHNDRTAHQMLSVVRELSRRDHSWVDCVVCCILSHGGKGSVVGVDGNPVRISRLTGFFDGQKCPTLVGKPKMFFIQACQGTLEQTGVPLPDAGVSFQAVCADGARGTIPARSDLLLAMSTVPSYCSYRDTTEGSWFIQSLCMHVIQMVPRRIDVLTMLTAVNEDVSQKTAGQKKQMPQPSFSLRKTVVFPVPTAPPPSLTDGGAADGAAAMFSVPDGPVLPSQRCSPLNRPM